MTYQSFENSSLYTTLPTTLARLLFKTHIIPGGCYN